MTNESGHIVAIVDLKDVNIQKQGNVLTIQPVAPGSSKENPQAVNRRIRQNQMTLQLKGSSPSGQPAGQQKPLENKDLTILSPVQIEGLVHPAAVASAGGGLVVNGTPESHVSDSFV